MEWIIACVVLLVLIFVVKLFFKLSSLLFKTFIILGIILVGGVFLLA